MIEEYDFSRGVRGKYIQHYGQLITGLLLVSVSQIVAPAEPPVEAAAARYAPGVMWRAKSVVTADFSRQGRIEHAILGTNQSNIVVPVFLNGINQPPEVLRYSKKGLHAATVELTTQDMNECKSWRCSSARAL